jgi:hypothetical protein
MATVPQEPFLAKSIAAAAVSNVSASSAGTAAANEFVAAWEELRSDIAAPQMVLPHVLADRPLWPRGIPHEAAAAWVSLRAALPKGEDWDVWTNWYERRLRGGSLGETFEITFAAVTKDIWEKGPAAANAWIRQHLQSPQTPERHIGEPSISDRASLETWLRLQSREVAIAIAGRAALRVAPLAVRLLRDRQTAEDFQQLATWTSAIYRSNALARVTAKYPAGAKNLRRAARAAPSAPPPGAHLAAYAALASAASAASAAAADSPACAAFAANSVVEALAAVSNADASDPASPLAFMWEQIRSDVRRTQELDVVACLDLPVWFGGAPHWAFLAWSSLQAALPEEEDWDVWIDWYDERLRGGSRGEQYDFVFADVPLEVWNNGAAAANSWIKEHLPKGTGDMTLAGLPEPLPDLDSPFTYAWNASARDIWTWVGLDAETKLVASFYVGERDSEAAMIFMDDLAKRVTAAARGRPATCSRYARLQSSIVISSATPSPSMTKNAQLAAGTRSLVSRAGRFRHWVPEENGCQQQAAGDAEQQPSAPAESELSSNAGGEVCGDRAGVGDGATLGKHLIARAAMQIGQQSADNARQHSAGKSDEGAPGDAGHRVAGKANRQASDAADDAEQAGPAPGPRPPVR